MRKKVECIKILKNIFKLFTDILITLELILIVLFLAPNLFGLKTYIVTSGSMEPVYPTGSLIYVKKEDPSNVKEGDVITFYMENTSIIATHQVYEIDKDKLQFRTQGINNIDEEGNIIHDAFPTNYSSLIGKPVLCIKYLGYINKILTNPSGRNIILIITIFIILINLILENKQNMEGYYEKNKEKK